MPVDNTDLNKLLKDATKPYDKGPGLVIQIGSPMRTIRKPWYKDMWQRIKLRWILWGYRFK